MVLIFLKIAVIISSSTAYAASKLVRSIKGQIIHPETFLPLCQAAKVKRSKI